ncbi:gamma-glutamyltransferase [Sphingorhabdus arenilitoris]|uniref:Glutathione hydrolase proenzyme n=1 Tax=Sphingorhabdus arenilitoris TaxID=1490041 RepID=A0ABV8RDW2_9SPHN
MKKIILSVLTIFVASFHQNSAAQDAQTAPYGVTSSADPRATEAGMEILEKGGSASDAAMAMMLALTVVEPQSSGIGGGGFLIYADGATNGLTTINGRETAPAAATPDRFLDENGKPLGFLKAMPGGRSVGVPGNIQLMAMAHRKWGRLPWADIFAPAIRLADEGYEVNETMAKRLEQIARLWGDFPEAQKLFWVDGKPAPAGTIIKNPALAETLRILASQGPDAFYTGEIAEQIVEAVQKAPVNAGDMTLSDLAAYKAKEQNALCTPYRVYVVCGMGPPSSGATTVLQILGTLTPYDMTKLGKDNPHSWYLLGQAMQLAYADREKYLGDPDFVDVPTLGLIDPDYLKFRSKLINPKKALTNFEAGTPPGASPRTAAVSSEVSGTTHFVAVDPQGSVATMTSTIEGIFGSQLIAGGFMLNNELTDFTFAPEENGAPVANRVEAGKRPLSSMSPTLVFDQNGRKVLALGSAGGKRIIMHVTKTLIGVLDFGLPLEEAIALPNIYFGRGKLMLEEETPLAKMAEDLAKYGQEVDVTDLGSKVNGAQLTVEGWRGAADPRGEGTAQSKIIIAPPQTVQ